MIWTMTAPPHTDHRIEQRLGARQFVERTLQTGLCRPIGHRQNGVLAIAADCTEGQIDVAARLNEALRGFGFS